MVRVTKVVGIAVVILGFSVCAFAQFNIQKIKDAGQSVASGSSALLSDGLKSELQNIVNMILQKVPQEQLLGKWKDIVTANKNMNIDSAIGFIKNLLAADQLKQQASGVAATAQDYSGLLGEMKNIAVQVCTR